MDAKFSQEIKGLGKLFQSWKRRGINRLEINHRRIGELFKGEAQKRVPVAQRRGNRLGSSLKKGIITQTKRTKKKIVTEVGTNVRDKKGFPYPTVIEFGAKHIAGGRVVALGNGVDISDAEAITEWQAKALRGNPSGEQMPFLRPAWNYIKPTAIRLLNESLKPPR